MIGYLTLPVKTVILPTKYDLLNIKTKLMYHELKGISKILKVYFYS